MFLSRKGGMQEEEEEEEEGEEEEEAEEADAAYHPRSPQQVPFTLQTLKGCQNEAEKPFPHFERSPLSGVHDPSSLCRDARA